MYVYFQLAPIACLGWAKPFRAAVAFRKLRAVCECAFLRFCGLGRAADEEKPRVVQRRPRTAAASRSLLSEFVSLDHELPQWRTQEVGREANIGKGGVRILMWEDSCKAVRVLFGEYFKLNYLR